MNLSPDDLAAVLAGARRCGDSSRDAFFQYVAQRIKYVSEPLDQTIIDALKRFGERQTNSSNKRPRRKN
jgi:hypothetical protein